MKQTLKAGALTASIVLEGRTLRSVTIPKKVPDGLTSDDLKKMLEMLGAYEIDLSGASPFQRRALEEMRRIPWGHAITYSELAKRAGSAKAVRAAGQACAKNALPLIIPCHRVMAEDGLGGFSCGLEWKQALLELEATE